MYKVFKKNISILLSLLILLSVCGCTAFSANAKEADAGNIAAVLSGMSTEEKVAQMLMPEFRYYNGSGVTVLSEKARDIIERRGFGGVILFAEQCLHSTDGEAYRRNAEGEYVVRQTAAFDFGRSGGRRRDKTCLRHAGAREHGARRNRGQL